MAAPKKPSRAPSRTQLRKDFNRSVNEARKEMAQQDQSRGANGTKGGDNHGGRPGRRSA